MIRKKQRFKKNLLSLALLAFCMSAHNNAHAQRKIDALNEGNVTFFVQDMTDMTKNSTSQNSASRVTKFLERHLHEHSRFVSTIKYIMPGHPAQETAISLNKQQFINNVQGGSETLKDYQTSIDIREIQISNDKTRATLRTNARETGTMNADGQDFPIEGNSSCTQVIKLSKKGIIQMYNATCQTEISFQEY